MLLILCLITGTESESSMYGSAFHNLGSLRKYVWWAFLDLKTWTILLAVEDLVAEFANDM